MEKTSQATCCPRTGKRPKLAKLKRKEEKSAEEVLKTLSGVPDSMKLGTLAVKYAALDGHHKICEASISALEKQCIGLQREKDQIQLDHGKQLLARNHLEGLCRELYRLNKMVKEDSVTRLREEEERRKEVTSKFETTLNEVTTMMQENTLKNDQLRDDNVNMTAKMKSFYVEFESRKQEQSKIDKQLSLERQLTQVQIEKAKLEIEAERVIWEEERACLTENWKRSENTCTELQFIVEELRKRMETYEQRHVGYKSAIDTNSRFFENCKTEIGSMNKKVILLEKEITMWKNRSQQNALRAMDISVVKQAQEAQLATAARQVESLQSLCRQLQGDRSSYLKILQARGIDPDSHKSLTDTPVSQKDLILKPIWTQLKVIKSERLSKKEKFVLEALERFIKSSKTQTVVNSAISLTLGFINVKKTAKNSISLPDYAQDLLVV